MTITPPPELVQWWATWRNAKDEKSFWQRIATEAAQWGADQELEACCKWLQCEAGDSATEFVAGDLRSARRPKPLSLKEQALEEVGVFEGMGTCNIDIIRRALEALPDDRA
jgi:hypothetical protein